jgi:hypothetical protein
MDVDSDEKPAESEEKAATSAKKKDEDSSEEKASPVKAEKVKSEENKPRTIQVDEYLVKFKNFSYLHCQWQTEAELLRYSYVYFSLIKIIILAICSRLPGLRIWICIILKSWNRIRIVGKIQEL